MLWWPLAIWPRIWGLSWQNLCACYMSLSSQLYQDQRPLLLQLLPLPGNLLLCQVVLLMDFLFCWLLLKVADQSHLNHPADILSENQTEWSRYTVYMHVWNCWRINKKHPFKKDRHEATLTGKNKFYRQGQVQQTGELLLANCSHTVYSVNKVCPQGNRKTSVCALVPLLELKWLGDTYWQIIEKASCVEYCFQLSAFPPFFLPLPSFLHPFLPSFLPFLSHLFFLFHLFSLSLRIYWASTKCQVDCRAAVKEGTQKLMGNGRIFSIKSWRKKAKPHMDVTVWSSFRKSTTYPKTGPHKGRAERIPVLVGGIRELQHPS